MWLLNNPGYELDKLKRFQEVVKTEKIKKKRAFKKGKDYLDTIKVPKKRVKKDSVNNEVSVKSIEKRQRLSKNQYSEYINSDEWKARKKEYFKRHKKECLACGSTSVIHLHHTSYENLGFENTNDLKPLCNKCHSEFHKLYGTKEQMQSQTKEYIRFRRRNMIDSLKTIIRKRLNKKVARKIRQSKIRKHM